MMYYVVVTTGDRVFRSYTLRRAIAYARLHGGLVYPARPGVGTIGGAIA